MSLSTGLPSCCHRRLESHRLCHCRELELSQGEPLKILVALYSCSRT